MRIPNARLDEIERKANEIAASALGKAQKQQDLLNLLKELGLPVHSADAHSTTLSYPLAFNRIVDWVSAQRAENHTRRSVNSSLISTLTAMLAVGITLVIHCQTRQLLTPSERPMLSAVDSKCRGSVNKDTARLEITLNAVLRNVGKHPAENVRVRVWGAPLDEPDDIALCRDFTMADTFYPDIQVTLSNRITVDLKKYDELKDQRKKVFLYVKMDYNDKFVTERAYDQALHFIYQIGRGVLTGATAEEKKAFESHLQVK